jgi:predicted glycosyltransferase involved in capsule biosynthesis
MYPAQTVVYYDSLRTVYYNPFNSQVFIHDKKKHSNQSFTLNCTIEDFLKQFNHMSERAKRRQRLIKHFKAVRRSEMRAMKMMKKASKKRLLVFSD